MKRIVIPLLTVALLMLSACVSSTAPSSDGASTPSAEPSQSIPAQEPAKELLDVFVNVETAGEDGKPVFTIKTNLPDKATLVLTLQDENFYAEQQTITVKNGIAVSDAFTDDGRALFGTCMLTVVMDTDKQPRSVQKVVGENGELLSGPLVSSDSDTGSNYIFVEDYYDSPYESENDIPMESLSLGDVYLAIGMSLSSGFGENYTLTQDGNTISATVWGDGVALNAALAANGSSENLEEWNNMVDNTLTAAERMQNLLNDNGHNDIIFIMQVANDMNEDHDAVLLSVSLGTVFYDFVNGIDLLG